MKGKILQIENEECILVVENVGYCILMNAGGASTVSTGDEAELWIETTVHDGQSNLFGFLTPQEKQWFRWLVNVPGVGGRVAQNILSCLAPNALQETIISGNVNLLKSADGVGLKIANRIISELKDKALKWRGENSSPSADVIPSPLYDLVQALCALGYKKQDAEQAVTYVTKQVKSQGMDNSPENILKLSLQRLATYG